jgi:hypothetical protein
VQATAHKPADSPARPSSVHDRDVEPSRPGSTPVAVARVGDGEDERALAVLTEFRNDLRSHHAVQSELATLIRDLHAPMRALPELARQQGGLMETLVDQSSRHRSRDQAIERSLQQLTEGASRQTQVLGLVQQQLDLNHETSIRVSDSLRDTASALGAFAATTDRQTRALEALAESTRRRLAQSERLERTLQFWLLVVSGLATLILLYALWAAMRVPPTPPARPDVLSKETDAGARAASGSSAPQGAPDAPPSGPLPPPGPSATPAASGAAPAASVAAPPGDAPASGDAARAGQPAVSPPRPGTVPATAAPATSPASSIP